LSWAIAESVNSKDVVEIKMVLFFIVAEFRIVFKAEIYETQPNKVKIFVKFSEFIIIQLHCQILMIHMKNGNQNGLESFWLKEKGSHTISKINPFEF
jgi:hypothetical protein